MAEVKCEVVPIVEKGVTLESISLLLGCRPWNPVVLLSTDIFLLNIHAFVLIFIIHLRNESIFQFGLSSVDGGIHIGG